MRARFKSWAKPYIEAHPEASLLEKDDPFLEGATLYLEIGSGKGNFILALAQRHPERHYIALERDVSCAGILAKKIVESGLPNVRLINADFDFVEELLGAHRFKTIYLNFSDPWPKKKHAKRRLTYAPRLTKILAFLAPGAPLILKTDNDGLYEFTKEEALKLPIECVLDEPDYKALDPEDAMTEYEANFRSEGHPIHRLVYKRKGETNL